MTFYREGPFMIKERPLTLVEEKDERLQKDY